MAGIEKTIVIDGQDVKFRASAAIPRIYRIKFGRDIYKDLAGIEKAVSTDGKKNGKEDSNIDNLSLEAFENIAYAMAKHADPTIPDSVEDWLDGFGTFSIYEILPQIIELWGLNVKTDSESKKKQKTLTVK